jgi:hypothetical protein
MRLDRANRTIKDVVYIIVRVVILGHIFEGTVISWVIL